MSQTRTVCVGTFHDAPSARRAIHEARAEGFGRIHLVTDDPAVRRELSAEIGSDKYLLSRSSAAIAAIFCLAGAGVGLLLGLWGAWLLAPGSLAVSTTMVFLPAGAIFGAFVGGMLSRGFTSRALDLDDHELWPDEILVAVEADSPSRIAAVEKILSHQHAAVAAPVHG
jgi:hypothetical protein